MKRIDLTFTGVDEYTDLGRLRRTGEKNPHVEFGVLAGSSTGKEPRFPRAEWIRILLGAAPRTALHVCGRLSRAVMDGDYEEVLETARGAGRIQVNAAAYRMDRIAGLADAAGREVILQLRTAPPAHGPAGAAFLWDRSGGRGVQGFEAWPETPAGVKIGYAGGVDPGNAAEAAALVRRIGGPGAWIDAESGVRSKDGSDRFLLDEVDRIIAAAG